jgi:hypothetical protein
MTELERDQLLADSDQIRDEVTPDANTETRVGTLFRNIVNFAYSAWLGITDETTHLLTPKEIREGADPETKLITLLDLPENDAKTIGLIGGKASVISWYIPTSGTSVTFDAPRSYGSWKSPRTAFTISLPEDLTDIPEIQKTSFFLQAEELPTDLTGDKVLWSGDAFDDTEGFVNLLDITFSQEPEDDYLLLVRNTVKEIAAGPVVDDSLAVFAKFNDTGNTFNDSSQYENNGIVATRSAPTTIITDPVLARVTGVDGNAVQWVTNSAGGSSAILGVFANHSSMNFNGGMTVMFAIFIPSGLSGTGLGLASKNAAAGSGFTIQKDTSGRLDFRINEGDAPLRARTSNDSNTTYDAWMHLAFVWQDEGGAKIYRNGTEILSTTATTETIGSSEVTPLYIGRVVGSTTIAPQAGVLMDDFKYHNAPKSAGEVLAEANRLGFGL